MQFKNTLRFLSISLLSAGLAQAAFAAACDDNFTSSGNFLSGKVYKTYADLPTISNDSAWQSAHTYALKDGWKITLSDQNLGIITAANNQAQRVMPINVVIEKVGAGSKMSMTYTTPGGASSPDDAVKSFFCKTVAAASAGATQSSSAPLQQAIAPVVGTAVSAASTPKRYPNTAPITSAQVERISAEFLKNVTDASMKTRATEAMPRIKEVLERLSCAQGIDAGWMLAYAVPGAPFGFGSALGYPMRKVPYHNQNACLTVTRIHGWTSPALNALRFEVVFLAEDSGESAKTALEIIKQPDGQWLFSYFL